MDKKVVDNIKVLDASERTLGDLYNNLFDVLFTLNIQEDVNFSFLDNLASEQQEDLLKESKSLLLLKLYEYNTKIKEFNLDLAFDEFCAIHKLDKNEAVEEVHMVFSTLEQVYDYMVEGEEYGELLIEKDKVTTEMMLSKNVGTPEQYLAITWVSCHKMKNGYVVFDL